MTMVAEILRVYGNKHLCPMKLAGLGVNQTKVIAGSAYVGSCALTRDLVDELLGEDADEPTGVADLLPLHEAATGASHDFKSLSTTPSVQQLLSTERHMALYTQLRGKVSVRSQNLMLASTMPHASDWLLAPPIPGLGLALGSDCFRTALKFRLGMPLFSESFPCAATPSSGAACDLMISTVIMRSAVTMELHYYFVTTAFATFLATRHELLVSVPL